MALAKKSLSFLYLPHTAKRRRLRFFKEGGSVFGTGESKIVALCFLVVAHTTSPFVVASRVSVKGSS